MLTQWRHQWYTKSSHRRLLGTQPSNVRRPFLRLCVPRLTFHLCVCRNISERIPGRQTNNRAEIHVCCQHEFCVFLHLCLHSQREKYWRVRALSLSCSWMSQEVLRSSGLPLYLIQNETMYCKHMVGTNQLTDLLVNRLIFFMLSTIGNVKVCRLPWFLPITMCLASEIWGLYGSATTAAIPLPWESWPPHGCYFYNWLSGTIGWGWRLSSFYTISIFTVFHYENQIIQACLGNVSLTEFVDEEECNRWQKAKTNVCKSKLCIILCHSLSLNWASYIFVAVALKLPIKYLSPFTAQQQFQCFVNITDLY